MMNLHVPDWKFFERNDPNDQTVTHIPIENGSSPNQAVYDPKTSSAQTSKFQTQ